MIKTSGYRVSPTEVEEVLYATGLVGEAAAFGVPHPTLGPGDRRRRHAAPTAQRSTPTRCSPQCRQRLPAYMVPARIDVRAGTAAAQPQRQDRPQAAGRRSCRALFAEAAP